MTHITEAERVYYGSQQAVRFVLDQIVAQRQILASKIDDTVKLKKYKDSGEWDLRKLGFCFREQAYKTVVDQTTGKCKKKRITKLLDTHQEGILWEGTLKSDGFVCDTQGTVRIEEKTGLISRPTVIGDLKHPRLRDLFSHLADVRLEQIAAVKDKRRAITLPINPNYPEEQVEITLVQTDLKNGREYRIFRLEIENVKGKCDHGRFGAFMAFFEQNSNLHRRDFSIADIVYSLHAEKARKREILDDRFVNILSIPGVEVKRGGKYRPVNPLGESMALAA